MKDRRYHFSTVLFYSALTLVQKKERKKERKEKPVRVLEVCVFSITPEAVVMGAHVADGPLENQGKIL